MASRRGRSRERRVVGPLAALALAVAWPGCASSEDAGGLPDDDVLSGEPSSGEGTASGSGSESPSRPAFEAGFEDDDEDDGGVPADEVETCLDPDDPGSSENVAKTLPDTDDCDNAMKLVKGVANGPVDVDFYRLSGFDKRGCKIDAMFESATAGIELCVALRCKKGETKFDSCAHGSLATVGGEKACCVMAPGKALPKWSCGGATQFDDSADMTIRVRQPNGSACLPYSFRYRF
jgi:hypothetical protein